MNDRILWRGDGGTVFGPGPIKELDFAIGNIVKPYIPMGRHDGGTKV